MSKRSNHIAGRVCVLVGVCLLFIAALVLSLWQWRIHTSAQKTEECVRVMRNLMPEPQSAALEERRDNTMPILSLEGTDYVGILEIPRYGSALPVCAKWGEVTKYPCRLDGSIYDRTIQLGGTSQKGQYDFYRELSAGDAVYFTDMEGNRYSYTVTDIRYEKHADQTALRREEAALTLFIKNIHAFEYIVVFCNPTI